MQEKERKKQKENGERSGKKEHEPVAGLSKDGRRTGQHTSSRSAGQPAGQPAEVKLGLTRSTRANHL